MAQYTECFCHWSRWQCFYKAISMIFFFIWEKKTDRLSLSYRFSIIISKHLICIFILSLSFFFLFFFKFFIFFPFTHLLILVKTHSCFTLIRIILNEVLMKKIKWLTAIYVLLVVDVKCLNVNEQLNEREKINNTQLLRIHL